MIEFEWNARKAQSNLKKHGVSFEEAQSVFYDELKWSNRNGHLVKGDNITTDEVQNDRHTQKVYR